MYVFYLSENIEYLFASLENKIAMLHPHILPNALLLFLYKINLSEEGKIYATLFRRILQQKSAILTAFNKIVHILFGFLMGFFSNI